MCKPPEPPPPPPPPTVEQVQAQIVANICEQYRPIVDQMVEYFPLDTDVVMAVMAQESACDKWATDGQSMGLMQVTPRPWTLAEEYLWQPKWNIWQGMKILHSAITDTKENPDGDVRRGLAAYNCGWRSLNAGECLYFGGYTYADRILDFWLPYFE